MNIDFVPLIIFFHRFLDYLQLQKSLAIATIQQDDFEVDEVTCESLNVELTLSQHIIEAEYTGGVQHELTHMQN